LRIAQLQSWGVQVCGWIDAVASKPVWAKMTPNITDIKVPARAALAAGMEGIAAINTIQSVIGAPHGHSHDACGMLPPNEVKAQRRSQSWWYREGCATQ
jgi:dihydroorotate dehydrogenase